MKKSVKFAVIVAIIVLIAGMALFPVVKKKYAADEIGGIPGSEQKSQGSGRQSALTVNAEIISYETLDDISRAKGRLIPDEEVDLSFETSGKITAIYFKEGTNVKKGDLLAKINDNPLKAELQKLQAQLPLAQARVQRQQTLLENDAVSKESFESVYTELEKLDADIDLVKAKLAQTELRAPFDGQIGLRQVSEGTYVSPTTVISKITKITPLKVEFSVNESQAYDIKPGTPLQFSWGNDQTKYDATVYAVEPRIDENLMTVMIRAIYPNTEGHIKPGHSATIELRLSRYENTIAIPSLAVITELGSDQVYVYKNGKAQATTIKKGIRTESQVQILDGLSVGDTLITTGVMQLRNGMDVKLNELSK